jgi:hypothetical protein
MRFSKRLLTVFVTLCGITTAACSGMGGGSFLGPSAVSGRAAGLIIDDSLYGPDSVKVVVAGARVELLDGPEKGRVTTTDGSGNFDLGVTSPAARLRATKEGWESVETTVDRIGLWLVMSQAPHTLYGFVYLPGSGTEPAAGVRVQIVGGPNAGATTVTGGNGLYRFDTLATQGGFHVELSQTGFRTDRIAMDGIRANKQIGPWRMTASSQ